jgi:hypothetical protein
VSLFYTSWRINSKFGAHKILRVLKLKRCTYVPQT